MITTLSSFWAWTPTVQTVQAPAPKPARAPLFIGDVATPHGRTTELHWQLRRDDDDARLKDDA